MSALDSSSSADDSRATSKGPLTTSAIMPPSSAAVNREIPTASANRRTISSAKKQFVFKSTAKFVTLYAGEEDKEKHMVHKDFACHSSPVLDAAFNGPYIEGKTQEYRLRDATSDQVRLLIHWLYTKTVSTDILGTSAIDPATHESVTLDFDEPSEILLCMWTLADQLLMRDLQNAIIYELGAERNKESFVVRTTILHQVYEKTTEDSLLRKFLVDVFIGWTHVKQPRELKVMLMLFPNEMVIDMMQKRCSQIGDAMVLKLDRKFQLKDYIEKD